MQDFKAAKEAVRGLGCDLGSAANCVAAKGLRLAQEQAMASGLSSAADGIDAQSRRTAQEETAAGGGEAGSASSMLDAGQLFVLQSPCS